MTNATPPALLTVPETAERLRITRRGVYNLINAGAIRTVNIASTGRAKTRIREDDLAAFIEARTAPGARRTA